METPDQKFARLMVDYSAHVKPGDRVAITSSTAAIPFVQELFRTVVARGAHPHVLIDIPEQEEILLATASDEQLEFVPLFHKMAFEEFDVLLKIRAETNTRAMTHANPHRVKQRLGVLAKLIGAQFQRGATGELRWMSTIYPTPAYAMEAEMGNDEFKNFFFSACHTDDATPDPVAYWEQIKLDQQGYVDRLQGHDQVALHGPNVRPAPVGQRQDHLELLRAGQSAGWRGLYRSGGGLAQRLGALHISGSRPGHACGRIELHFKDGKVVKASAEKNRRA